MLWLPRICWALFIGLFIPINPITALTVGFRKPTGYFTHFTVAASFHFIFKPYHTQGPTQHLQVGLYRLTTLFVYVGNGNQKTIIKSKSCREAASLCNWKLM